ncbi:MAG: gamma-glutamyltransferase, partial [Actinomycetota bacterium]
AAPRWLVGGMAPEGEMPEVLAEADVPASTIDALRASGYGIDTMPARSGSAGHAHLIRAVAGGFEAGSDPRADGGALAS